MKKLFTLWLLFIVVYGTGRAQICDTLLNQQPVLDTPVLLRVNSTFVAGNNSYGDLAKAEGFASLTGDSIASAFLYFAYITINAADSDKTIQVNVWDNTGTSGNGAAGAPGNIIDSAAITLRQVARAVTLINSGQEFMPVAVDFTNHIVLTGDTFYVGIVLPHITGDTVALFTNEGPDGNGWEQEIENNGDTAWGTYVDDWLLPGGIGNYIAVSVCGRAPLANFAAGNYGLCPPDSVQFTDESVDSASTWQWNFGDGTADTGRTPWHVYATGGTYTVIETVSGPGGSSTHALDVTVKQIPAALLAVTGADSAGSATGAVALTITSGSAPYTYLWSTGATTQNVSNLQPGSYAVTITADGCVGTDTAYVGIATGINNIDGNVFVDIFPNPATDVLNFVWNVNSEAAITMYDVTGNIVGTFVANGTGVHAFVIHNLATGTYLVRVTEVKNGGQRTMLFSKM